MALIKIKEMIGTSTESFDEAIKGALRNLKEQKNNLSGAKVVSQSVRLTNGDIAEYRVDLKVAYKWDKELHGK